MGQRKRVAIPPSVRAALLHADAECHYCGSTPEVIDHFVPVVAGGGSEPGNLVAACRRCNGEKSGRTPSEWRRSRIERGYPWPPPNTDMAAATALMQLPVNLAELSLRGIRARDARLLYELDSIADRLWRGQQNTVDEDVRILANCLRGLDERLVRARKREMEKLVTMPAAHKQGIWELWQREAAHRKGSVLNRLRESYRRQVAEQVAFIADGFFSDSEDCQLRTMVEYYGTAAGALHRVAAETAPMIARSLNEFGDSSDEDLRARLFAVTKSRAIDHLMRFAEKCDLHQRELLYSLLRG